MPGFKQGWQAFRQGFDLELLSEYWKAVKEHAWEVLWGAGVIGIPFAIVTLYYSPARSWLGFAIALVILLGGYHVWRADHVRLLKRISIGPVRVILTNTLQPNGQPGADRVIAQVSVQAAVDARIETATGKLLSVSKWDEVLKDWQPTAVDEPLDLMWSVRETETRQLEV
ncbi:MAG TPA: hypothetical protein VEN79_01045, partial [Terriglobia bacterium]|nr:hypothetical protein [Terriglobia bacterium]